MFKTILVVPLNHEHRNSAVFITIISVYISIFNQFTGNHRVNSMHKNLTFIVRHVQSTVCKHYSHSIWMCTNRVLCANATHIQYGCVQSTVCKHYSHSIWMCTNRVLCVNTTHIQYRHVQTE